MENIIYIGPERPFSRYPGGNNAALMAECVEYCSKHLVLGVDTETAGLDFTCKKLLMVQIGNEERQYVIDARYIDISPLREILENKEILKVLHNVKFDYKFLLSAGIRMENVWDTMLVEQVLYCGDHSIRNSLGEVVDRRLGVKVDKSVRNLFIDMRGEAFSDKQIHYGGADIEHLLAIRNGQLVDIEIKAVRAVVKLENEASLAFADIEYNGMDIDSAQWLEISKEYSTQMQLTSLSLDKMIRNEQIFSQFIAKYVQGDLFGGPVRDIDINWDSPTQVRKVFRKIVPELENVNGKDLYIHRSKHPLIPLYIRYKEQMKIVSSYGEAFLAHRLSDGRIHTSFRQVLATGRVSSNEPNMQQIPADNRFRNCFKPPLGWKFVSADYSSQELNVIAYGSQDPVWLKALQDGEDLHSVCAALVYGKKWQDAAEMDCLYMESKQKCECTLHKKLRTNVKSINFGLAYGMGPKKLADTLEISLSEAKTLISDYFIAFPYIQDFLNELADLGVYNGYAKTFPPFKRKRWFPGWFPGIERSPEDSEMRSSIERASKNTPIQGTGADMTKCALVLCRNHIHSTGIRVKLVMTVHDQIDSVCHPDEADSWKLMLKSIMEKAALLTIKNGLLKAEPEISEVWKK